jgi:hypothetical protein
MYIRFVNPRQAGADATPQIIAYIAGSDAADCRALLRAIPWLTGDLQDKDDLFLAVYGRLAVLKHGGARV